MSQKLFHYLNYFTPSLLIDIGAYQGTFTHAIRSKFPDIPVIMFEPSDHPELTAIPNSTLYKNILYHSNTQVPWFSNNTSGDSIYKENTHFYTSIEQSHTQAQTLDSILPSLPHNILLKLDSQGSEPDILNGASQTLQKTTLLQIEVPVFGKYNNTPYTFQDYITTLSKYDFVLLDILDQIPSPTGRFTVQTDMLFIHKGSELYEKFRSSLSNELKGSITWDL